MKLRNLSVAALALAAFFHVAVTSCDDETSTIGSSIVEDHISITIDSLFTVDGRPVANTALQSRTLLQLLGRIDAEGYGSLSSEVVTQFMPSVTLDTTGVTVEMIDSMKLMLGVYHGNFVGDSITPMGIEVYRLNRNLPSPIYSNFDPTGYYSPSDKLGSRIYNASTMGESDSLRNLTAHTVTVDMPLSLAREMFTAYKENPAIFASPSEFIDKIFKGVYIRNSYGNGRLTLVSNTLMRVYYHTMTKTDDGRDSTIFKMANYFAVTPEIVTNNNIGLNIADDVREMIDAGENIVVSPAGYDVEFKFPIHEVISSYNSGKGTESAINSLTFSVPVDSVKNKFGFGPAPYILMVLKSKKNEFFANNSLPDNETSFYAEYNAAKRCYSFSSMRAYLLKMLEKETLSEDDYTFVFTPVNVNVETSGDYYYGTTATVTSVTPYITTPTMAKFSFDEAKIRFTYSNQMINY